MSDQVLSIVIQARDEAQKTLKQLQKEINNLEKANGSASSSFSNSAAAMGSSLTYVKKHIHEATALATGFFASMGLVGSRAITVAGDIEASTMAFKTLLGDMDQANLAVKNILEDAKLTPFDFQGLIDGNQLLISANVAADDARKTILDLGNAIVATGGGNAEMNRIVANLQQIRNVGKASEMDMKQFAFAGINMYDLLSASTKKSIGQLKEMDITYEMIAEALAVARAEGGKFEGALEDQGGTMRNVISNTGDVINQVLGDIASKTKIFETVKSVFLQVQTTLLAVTPTFINLINFITENQAALTIALGAISGAIVMMGISIATALGPATLTLAGFMAVGAALAAVGYLLYEAWNNNFLGIQNVTNALMELAPIFTNAFTQISQFVLPILQQIYAELSRFWLEISPYLMIILESLTQNFILQFEWIKMVTVEFVDFIREHWDEISNILDASMKVMGGLVKVGWSLISNTIKIGLAVLTGDWNAAWQAIKDAFRGVWEGMKLIVSGAWQAIEGVIKAGINRVIGMINKMIESINSVDIAGVSANIPTLPKFENGGWVSHTGPAIVHQGEFVLSRAMLNGTQQIPNNVVNNDNRSTYINAPINTPMDAMSLSHILGFELATSGRF